MLHSPVPLLIGALVAHLAVAAQAQPITAQSDDIPMADYLALLAQVAPAARDGAEAYVQAVRQTCRKTLSASRLRRAISEGTGDAVLMAMIRASQLHDTKTLVELSQRVDCRGFQ